MRWTPRGAPRRDTAPMLWTLLCDEWLRLDKQKCETWWRSLERAHWSRAVELWTVFVCRNALLGGQGSMSHFLTTNVSPQVLVATLEDQIKEGVLPAPVARRIEDAVLLKTHASGLWL